MKVSVTDNQSEVRRLRSRLFIGGLRSGSYVDRAPRGLLAVVARQATLDRVAANQAVKCGGRQAGTPGFLSAAGTVWLRGEAKPAGAKAGAAVRRQGEPKGHPGAGRSAGSGRVIEPDTRCGAVSDTRHH